MTVRHAAVVEVHHHISREYANCYYSGWKMIFCVVLFEDQNSPPNHSGSIAYYWVVVVAAVAD